MKPIPSVLAAGLALCAMQICAQSLTTSITPQTISGAVGATVDLQLKVTNFTNVATFQCPIKYDGTVLEFLSADNFGLPGMTALNSLANPQTPTPRVTVSYLPDFGQYPNGVTVPAGTVVMTMHFKVKANGTSVVNLASNVPPGIEVYNATGNNLTVDFQSGGATVTGGAGGGGGNNPPAVGFQIRATADTVSTNENFCMPVKVNDFNKIAAMQYSMHWNKNVLQYTGVQDFSLNGLDASSFGAAKALTDGVLNVQWGDPTALGVTKANASTIYKVCFKAIGADGTTTNVYFDGLGFPPGSQFAEAYTATGQQVWDNNSNQPATITVQNAVAPPPSNAITFKMDTVVGIVSNSVCMDMKVKNFNDVVVAQMGFTYDPAKLSFESIQLGSNPLTLQQGSGIFHQAAGNAIKMSWTDPTGVTGVDLPDGTTIFSTCFKVLGPNGSLAALDIKDLPNFPVEVYTQQGNNAVQVTPATQDGAIDMKTSLPCNVSVVVDNMVPVKCNGGTTGAINITASSTGPTPQFTYNWSGPSFSNTNADISGLKAGTYNLTVTNTFNGGCTTTTSVVVTEPADIAPTATPTAVSCNGSQDGAIALNLTGGTAPYTYAWAGPNSYTSNQQNINNLRSGNYTVTISDANSCTKVSGAILVAQPTAVDIPQANIQVVNVKCFGGTDGTINLTATGGTAPYTYTWSANGFASVTQAPPLSGLAAKNYTVSVTDNKGCTLIKNVAVTQPSSAVTALIDSHTDVKCFGEENGTVATTVIGGTTPYTFAWKNANGLVVSAVQNPVSLAPGTYSVTVTDANNCTVAAFPASVTIEGPPSQLSIVKGVTVDVNCFGENTGSASVIVSGGWPGTPTVNWSGTTKTGTTITGLAAGTYTPTVIDPKGCSVTLPPITVAGPNAPLALTNTIVNHVTCNGKADGKITTQIVGGTAPYPTITWSPGNHSGQQITNLAPGLYIATITDSKGCTAVQAGVQVNEPTVLTATANVVDQNGPTPGTITVTPTGGTTPYNFTWTGPGSSSSNTITGTAGTYRLTITDNNGCTYTNTYMMGNSLPVLAVEVLSTKGDCGGNGCIQIAISAANVVGSLKPYTIRWTGNGVKTGVTTDTVDICGLANGAYNITVTSATNSVPGVATNILVPALPIVFHSSSVNNPNEDFGNGKIDLTPIVPQGYTYQWSNGATTQDLLNLDEGCYTVTITAPATGCFDIDTFCLTRIWRPLVHKANSPSIQRPSCVSSEDGSITLDLDGGHPPFSYKWTGPGVTAADTTRILATLGAGFYNLTVTDRNGTTLTGTWSLTPLSNIQVAYAIMPGPNGWDVSGENECDGEVKLTVTGHVDPMAVLWVNNETGIKNTDLCAGDWWAIVTDGVGCKDTVSGVLTAPEGIVFTTNLSNFNGYNVKCFGGNEGQATVSASGGVAPYLIKWSTGFSETLTSSNDVSQQKQLAAGDYTVTITDANGVKTETSITLTQPDSMTIEFLSTLPSRFTECDGEILASSNGAEPITFKWTSKQHNGTGAKAEGLCAGEDLAWLATDANGCRANAMNEMGYPDDGCLLFSPVLTPGQTEERNDFLYITCAEAVPDNSLEIYNRWGQLVFQAEGYDNASNTWKGTNSKEQPLPEGVYYYVFSFTNQFGEPDQRKGYINLLR